MVTFVLYGIIILSIIVTAIFVLVRYLIDNLLVFNNTNNNNNHNSVTAVDFLVIDEIQLNSVEQIQNHTIFPGMVICVQQQNGESATTSDGLYMATASAQQEDKCVDLVRIALFNYETTYSISRGTFSGLLFNPSSVDHNKQNMKNNNNIFEIESEETIVVITDSKADFILTDTTSTTYNIKIETPCNFILCNIYDDNSETSVQKKVHFVGTGFEDRTVVMDKMHTTVILRKQTVC